MGRRGRGEVGEEGEASEETKERGDGRRRVGRGRREG